MDLALQTIFNHYHFGIRRQVCKIQTEKPQNEDEQYLINSVLHSLEQGVNFIDTARTYGDLEEILGKALKQWRGERPFIA